MSSRRVDVAVIGGGVAGSSLTIALASTAPAGYALALFDPSEPGPGTAYAPQSPSLLMNGPVRAMSPVPGDPAHFARYLVDEPEDALVCRARYGAYVRATVAAALSGRRDFHYVADEAIDVARDGDDYVVRSRSGTSWRAAAIVLALGNFTPSDAFLPDDVRGFAGYHRDPWRTDISNVSDGSIALLGSRLTAMDVVALLEERAFRGRIHLISRHGLLPLVENPRVRGIDPPRLNLDTSTPYALLRSLRRAARNHDGDWRAVVESLRSITPAIWSGWSDRERRRFLRHAQSMWAIHRYRVPAATHAAFLRVKDAGRISNHRARIEGASRNGKVLELRLRNESAATILQVEHIVNCTGPESNIERVDHALVRALRDRGLVRADRLKLGIDADEAMNVLDERGLPQERMFAIGPLLRGLWYETTAVPEIARQAGIISRVLLAQRERPKECAG